MLDTNTVSYLVSGRSPAARRAYLDADRDADIVISAITEAEIRFGLEKKPQAARLREATEVFFRTVTILPWNSHVAQHYGRFRARVNAIGKSLSVMDTLIASHAFAAEATLVSHDQAFGHLTAYFSVVDWATDL